MAVLDASQVSITGLFMYGLWKTGALTSAFFSSLNALWHSSDQTNIFLFAFLSNVVNGLANCE